MNQNPHRILSVAAGLVLLAHAAYDCYTFTYLTVNHGVWLSPFGLLSPYGLLAIGLTSAAFGLVILTQVRNTYYFPRWAVHQPREFYEKLLHDLPENLPKKGEIDANHV